MINKQKVFGLLGICTKAGKIVFGSQACEELVEKKKAKLIIIADNAAERTKKNFRSICQRNNVDCITFGQIDEMSKAIGKENKAILGIKDKNLSNEILKIINGGDLIGENKNT